MTCNLLLARFSPLLCHSLLPFYPLSFLTLVYYRFHCFFNFWTRPPPFLSIFYFRFFFFFFKSVPISSVLPSWIWIDAVQNRGVTGASYVSRRHAGMEGCAPFFYPATSPSGTEKNRIGECFFRSTSRGKMFPSFFYEYTMNNQSEEETKRQIINTSDLYEYNIFQFINFK